MDQLKGQIHLSGALSGLCWIVFRFVKDMTFRFCSSPADSFLLLPFLLFSSSFLRFYMNVVHTKFSDNRSLRIILLVQKYITIPVKCVMFGIFCGYNQRWDVFLWQGARNKGKMKLRMKKQPMFSKKTLKNLQKDLENYCSRHEI